MGILDVPGVPRSSDSRDSVIIGTGAFPAAIAMSGVVAIGTNAMSAAVAPGNGVVAIGKNCLTKFAPGSTGRFYVAVGTDAAFNNTTGYDNAVFGAQALRTNTSGYDNTAIGCYAMRENDTGAHCTAVGESALYKSRNDDNTAVGGNALHELFSGFRNTALGVDAGGGAGVAAATANVSGHNNTYIGYQAWPASATQSSFVTAVGAKATTDGNYALALGVNTVAGAAGSAAIGTDSGGVGASTTVANEIRIGTANHSVRVPGLFRAESVLSPSTGDLNIYGGGAGNDLFLNAINGRNIVLGPAAVTPNAATSGFTFLRTVAGTPTGVPAPAYAGRVAMVFDTTANKLWFYNAGWKGVVVA